MGEEEKEKIEKEVSFVAARSYIEGEDGQAPRQGQRGRQGGRAVLDGPSTAWRWCGASISTIARGVCDTLPLFALFSRASKGWVEAGARTTRAGQSSYRLWKGGSQAPGLFRPKHTTKGPSSPARLNGLSAQGQARASWEITVEIMAKSSGRRRERGCGWSIELVD